MAAQAILHNPISEKRLSSKDEALIARLTRAAYDVALRHASDQPFTDLELALWHELRAVYQEAGEVD